jgi:hypothetical protein
VPCFSAFGGQQFFVKKQTTINQNISQNTNKNKLASLQKQGAKEEERGLGEECPDCLLMPCLCSTYIPIRHSQVHSK